MPPGLTAKLHSLVASNSAACLSFIIARAISAVCCGGQRLARYRREPAVDLDGRRETGRDEEVGRLFCDHRAAVGHA